VTVVCPLELPGIGRSKKFSILNITIGLKVLRLRARLRTGAVCSRWKFYVEAPGVGKGYRLAP
jgi:hypothetical protein